MSYYIKGIGAYRGAGDVNRWLKIRSIEKDGNRIAIKFRLGEKINLLHLLTVYSHTYSLLKVRGPTLIQ